MKKVFMLFLFAILLVGTVQAAILTTHSYQEADMKVEFRTLGMLYKGDATLASHSSVAEVLKTGYGGQFVTMYYDMSFDEIQTNGLGTVEFIDMRTGKNVQREYDYVIWEEITYDSPTFTRECNTLKNGTEACEDKQTGTEKKTKMDWVKMKTKDIPKGGARIGIRTYVEENDYIDGVWTIVDERITKHASWSASLDTDLVAYYNLNEVSGPAIDVFSGQYNGTLVGSPIVGVTGGPNGTSYCFEGAEGVNLTTLPNVMNNNNVTYSFWSNFTASSAMTVFTLANNADGDLIYLARPSGSAVGKMDIQSRDDDGGSVEKNTATLATNDGKWHHYAVVMSSDSNYTLYIDGAADVSGDPEGTTYTVNSGCIGYQCHGGGASGFYTGCVDEAAIWNRSLTSAEVLTLSQNVSYPGEAPSATGPTVTLESPADNFVSNNENVTLEYSCTDATNVTNVSLYVDDVLNTTTIWGTSNDTGTISTPLSFTEGIHPWNVTCWNNNSMQGNGTERDLNITFQVPGIVQNSPADNFNTTNISTDFNCSATPFNTSITNVSIYIDGVVNQSNSSGLTGDYIFSLTDFPEGNYNWSCEAEDGHGKTNITDNRTLIVHLTTPEINITSPNGTIDYIKIGDNLSLEWIVSEPGRNLSEHITNCSYMYNDSVTYLTIPQCVETNQTNFTYINDLDVIFFNITDQFGLTQQINNTWDFKVKEINQTFNTEVTEGSIESFEAGLGMKSGISVSAASLVYNGTNNLGSITVSGSNTIVSESIIIPDVSGDTNASFYWALVLSDASLVNLSSQNQSIFNISISNCTGPPNLLLNFTQVDEELQTNLASNTIEAAINVYTNDRSSLVINGSGTFTSNPTGICLNRNLTDSSNYSLDATVKYTSDGYAVEYYNIFGLELTNDTEVQQITLFSLNSSDSTDFQITFTGDDFLPVENALVFIERQYLAENVFKTVELPKTDSNGQTVVHLVRNDVVYNIIVTLDNSVLGTFSNIRAFCDDFTIGDCTIPLNALDNESGLFRYDEEVGITYDSAPSFNETDNTISFDYVSTDGTAKLVTMTIERRDVFGNLSICNSTLAAASGTLSCNVGNISDTTLNSLISVDGTGWISNDVNLDGTAFGSMGYVFYFVLSLALVLKFSDSKNGAIIAVAIGYISAMVMGWIIGGMIGVSTAGLWMIVLTIAAIWEVNRKK